MFRRIVSKTAQRRFLTDQTRNLAPRIRQSQPPPPNQEECCGVTDVATSVLMVAGFIKWTLVASHVLLWSVCGD